MDVALERLAYLAADWERVVAGYPQSEVFHGPPWLDFLSVSQLTEVFARQGLAPTYGVRRVRQLIRTVGPSGQLLLLRVRDPDGESLATGISVGRHEIAVNWGTAHPQARQVLAGWTIAEQARCQALNQRTIDVKTLRQISTGNTSRAIFQMISERRAGTVGGHHVTGGLFTVGYSTHAIRSITVKGRNATLEYCGDDQSYEVDTHGATVIPAPGVALLRGVALLKFSDTTQGAVLGESGHSGCSGA